MDLDAFAGMFSKGLSSLGQAVGSTVAAGAEQLRQATKDPKASWNGRQRPVFCLPGLPPG